VPLVVQDSQNKLFPERQSATFSAVNVKGKLARYDAEATRVTGSIASSGREWGEVMGLQRQHGK
jgi:hypothetical protein